ncbi:MULTISPECIES: hypothetical protein [unclassified Streptomyces]|nr:MULTISPECIES: hypothetical protein [unclassified Streptomyces]
MTAQDAAPSRPLRQTETLEAEPGRLGEPVDGSAAEQDAQGRGPA